MSLAVAPHRLDEMSTTIYNYNNIIAHKDIKIYIEMFRFMELVVFIGGYITLCSNLFSPEHSNSLIISFLER